MYLFRNIEKCFEKIIRTGVGKPGRGSQDAPRPRTFLYSGGAIVHVGAPKVSLYLTLSWLSFTIDVSESGRVFSTYQCLLETSLRVFT